MPDADCGFHNHPDGPAQAQQLLVVLGPTLIVDIGFDPAFDPTKIGSQPVTQLKGVRALVDTGATQSCLDSNVATTLNLPIIDRQKISGVGGVHDANIYLGQIYVPSLNSTIYGPFAGVNLSAGGQPHIALIGRTFLQHITLSYDGRNGKVTMTL
jgi:predicted aspartyl protease